MTGKRGIDLEVIDLRFSSSRGRLHPVSLDPQHRKGSSTSRRGLTSPVRTLLSSWLVLNRWLPLSVLSTHAGVEDD